MVVTLWQILANLTQLLFHDMKVVDQPFGRRRDGPAFSDRIDECSVTLEQFATIIFQSRQQQRATPGFDGLMLSGQGARVLLEAFDAEQFFPDGLFIRRVGRQVE
jgi:hypothetical protein